MIDKEGLIWCGAIILVAVLFVWHVDNKSELLERKRRENISKCILDGRQDYACEAMFRNCSSR